MTDTQRKKTMTREQATALYDDLHKSMKRWMAQKEAAPASIKKAPRQGEGKGSIDARQLAQLISSGLAGQSSPARRTSTMSYGLVITFLLVAAGLKATISGLEAFGLLSAPEAHAAVLAAAQQRASAVNSPYDSEERKVLVALDGRRADLEERRRKLDEREKDLERRDREYAARATEVREMTNRLKLARETTERRQDSQIAQLSKVYSSMNPPEAAQLIEQLDVTIALELLERMSDKRLAQILALMTSEKALTMTRMLSGK